MLFARLADRPRGAAKPIEAAQEPPVGLARPPDVPGSPPPAGPERVQTPVIPDPIARVSLDVVPRKVPELGPARQERGMVGDHRGDRITPLLGQGHEGIGQPAANLGCEVGQHSVGQTAGEVDGGIGHGGMVAHATTVARVMADCVFCRIVSGALPSHVVLDAPEALAFLDQRPVFPGHVLVVPREHHVTLVDLPPTSVGPFFSDVRRVAQAVREGLGCDGTFVAMNNTVSQSVPHLHCHVVPRRFKDGLRGFFWPRHSYASDDDAAAVADQIREAVPPGERP